MSLPTIGFDEFAKRSFAEPVVPDKDFRASNDLRTSLYITPKDFMSYMKSSFTSPSQLKDGYAAFCKHLFIPNPYPVYASAIPLSPEVEAVSKCGYKARRSEELPVLSRWVEVEDLKLQQLDLSQFRAKFIDCILYSRDQIHREYAAMNQSVDDLEPADFYLISLKFQMEDHETPMQPMTMMRNALITEGGSGVDIDRSKYLNSVAYWEGHVELGCRNI